MGTENASQTKPLLNYLALTTASTPCTPEGRCSVMIRAAVTERNHCVLRKKLRLMILSHICMGLENLKGYSCMIEPLHPNSKKRNKYKLA